MVTLAFAIVMSLMTLYGGVEAGGTKFVCAIGTGRDDLRRTSFATTSPAETFARCIEFFHAQCAIAALGIASFGPVDLDPRSPTHGFITSTPKAGWRHTDIAGSL